MIRADRATDMAPTAMATDIATAVTATTVAAIRRTATRATDTRDIMARLWSSSAASRRSMEKSSRVSDTRRDLRAVRRRAEHRRRAVEAPALPRLGRQGHLDPARAGHLAPARAGRPGAEPRTHARRRNREGRT